MATLAPRSLFICHYVELILSSFARLYSENKKRGRIAPMMLGRRPRLLIPETYRGS